MKPIKFAILFISSAILAVLGKIIWHPAKEAPMPTGIQLPLFAFLAIVEAAALFIGVWFFVTSKKLISKTSANHQKILKPIAYATTWLLTNWWMHDNLHMYNGLDLNGLLLIDYFFHVSLICASVVLAVNFLKLIKE